MERERERDRDRDTERDTHTHTQRGIIWHENDPEPFLFDKEFKDKRAIF